MSEQNDAYRDLTDPCWREREAAIDAELKALIPPCPDPVATIAALQSQKTELEAESAAATKYIGHLLEEVAKIRAELAKEQSFVHALKGLHAGDIESLNRRLDAALKDQARWLHWRRCFYQLSKMETARAAGIDLTRVYIDSPEKLDERTDAAIAAREGR